MRLVRHNTAFVASFDHKLTTNFSTVTGASMTRNMPIRIQRKRTKV